MFFILKLIIYFELFLLEGVMFNLIQFFFFAYECLIIPSPFIENAILPPLESYQITKIMISIMGNFWLPFYLSAAVDRIDLSFLKCSIPLSSITAIILRRFYSDFSDSPFNLCFQFILFYL